MATINYNGMELEEVTEPQIFDPPKRMLVWDNSANIKIGIVAAILPGVGFPITTIDEDGIIQAFHLHCAEIHDHPKPRRATNRELSRWLARANRAIEKIAWFKLWNASISTMNPEDRARQEYDKWKKNLGKFLAKVEEYR